MDIRDSIVLITSAGTSLGCTLANHFSSLGAKVIVTDTDAVALEKMVGKCVTSGHRVLSLPVDSYSSNNIETLFSTIKETLGCTVDVLINYWPSNPLPSLTSQDSGEEFSVQLGSLASPIFSFGKVGSEHMREKSTQSVIINITTYPEDAPHEGLESATSMISGFTKSWARELTPFNIRVGGIVPGQLNSANDSKYEHWALIQDELIRSTEYIVSNEYFSGRVVAAEA